MKVLVACEFSGVVRNAFNHLGHEAYSCDLLPSKSEEMGWHIQGDVLEVINDGWDMMIAFPPCTHLAISGAQYFSKKQEDGRQQEAVGFFMHLANAPIERIAIENPVGIMSTRYRKPDQYIHPYMFGHPVSKKTCLWLKNLPPLRPTTLVEPEWHIVESTGKRHSEWDWQLSINKKTRAHLRSVTFTGVAEAMADQWGRL